MNEDFSTAVLLMAVGMVTVFVILALIVVFGNWLILIVNKYFPQPVRSVISQADAPSHEIDSKKLAAIVSAVDIVTKGRGKVESVKKVD